MANEKILIVDDEELIRWTLSAALNKWGYQPLDADSCHSALASFYNEHPRAVLLDIYLPDGSGMEVLREIKRHSPHTIVIIVTANVVLDETIAALRGGAYDFISKPINLDELEITLRNGLETQQLRKQVGQIRKEHEQKFSFDQIIGASDAIQQTLSLARKVSESDASSVLLQGESGTGKDLIAKAIHYNSSRSQRPFVAINCATLPTNLIESELFGYEKGAFTDAKARKEGLLEQAEGGTIFLDEIGELELGLQAKLLRVLEEGTFRRVGGLKDIPLDVRVIAASNRDLKAESEANRFRLDLYYRLSVLQIDIPPLRARGDDVLVLAHHYIMEFNSKFRQRIRGLSEEVEELFKGYGWPGNVRELRNCIERAMILEDGDLITVRYLPRPFHPEAAAESISLHAIGPFMLPAQGVNLAELELAMVCQALERSKGNQTHAADLLGITRDQLRYRQKKIQAQAATA